MKKWMKRLSVVAASLVAMVALAACGKSSSSSSEPQLVTKGDVDGRAGRNLRPVLLPGKR